MNKKGFAGMILLMAVSVMIIIASTVLFDFTFTLFRIGQGEENISTDYERLSSGIYYGVWLVDNAKVFPQNLNVDGVVVRVNYSAATRIITAGPVNNRSIAVQYEDGIITSWD